MDVPDNLNNAYGYEIVDRELADDGMRYCSVKSKK